MTTLRLSQTNRPLAVETPLGEDVLILERMTGTEELGRLFRYELELISEHPEKVNFDKIIGQNVTVRLDLASGDRRYFNGFVSQFTQTCWDGDATKYRAVVVPWLWFLTRTADCRIFQDMTVPDIIKKIFRDLGYSDFDDESLSRDPDAYRTWEYCVQYRETAFDFVSRLMEQEGIYYFFKHENGKHELVMADSPAAHDEVPDSSQLPYHPLHKQPLGKPTIWQWSIDRKIKAASYAVGDFDFEKPDASLRGRSEISRDHAAADGEVYDYPGEYKETSQAENYAKIRIQELQARYELAHGESDARGISIGNTFTLTGYPIEDKNRPYLITSVTYKLTSDLVKVPGDGNKDRLFSCSFTAIDAQQNFRTPRTTPLPHIRGPQTAIVVGPEGEKIHTDKYGRVKVQFPWDREGGFNADSSCWVRVSQNWAGKTWGGMFIPHVGQEVIVECLEGDPDRPIITGRVYNAKNMPPEDLPENKHKSIIRDDYGNEMIFDATPDDEHIRIHSPHHKSSITLGKSIQSITESDSWTTTYGASGEFTAGTSLAFTIGHTAEAKLGTFTDLTIGHTMSCYIGPQITFGAAFNYSYFKGPVIANGADGIYNAAGKTHTIIGEKEMQIMGGQRTVLDMDAAGIYLGITPAAIPSDSMLWWAQVGIVIGALVAQAVVIGSSLATAELDEEETAYGLFQTAIMLGAFIAAMIASAALYGAHRAKIEAQRAAVTAAKTGLTTPSVKMDATGLCLRWDATTYIKLSAAGIEMKCGAKAIELSSVQAKITGDLLVTTDVDVTGDLEVATDLFVRGNTFNH